MGHPHLTWTVLENVCYPNIPWLLSQQRFDEVVWFGPAGNRFSTTTSFPAVCGTPIGSSNLLTSYVRDKTTDAFMGDNRFTELPFFVRILNELTSSGVEGIGKGTEVYAAAFGKAEQIRLSCEIHGNLDQYHVVSSSDVTLCLRLATDKTNPTPPAAIEHIVQQQDTFPEQLTQSFSHYVIWAKVQRPSHPDAPVGHIAKQWSKLIGKRGIPIEPAARQLLLTDVCSKSNQLAEYVKKWQLYLPTFLKEPY